MVRRHFILSRYMYPSICLSQSLGILSLFSYNLFKFCLALRPDLDPGGDRGLVEG